ncbi:MAG TPA: ABC transporter substrate-binding protein [Candidatus Acidoferrales bacterium]|jgi:NitT/TauT family transport system substrate-binding protein|nr:ABC transporter substrate-binding protein [Candidatus Acidoferrales bacterium]
MIRRTWFAVAAAAAIAVSACSPSESPAPSGSPGATAGPSASPGASGEASGPPIDHVRLQLDGPVDAEFAGYIAAQALGYYDAEGVAVDLVPGGGSVDPVAAGSATSGPEFTIAWVPQVLAAREHSSDLVDIAQVFQRSGTALVAWASSNLKTPCDLKGQAVGVWAAPADLEVTSMLTGCSLTAADYTAVPIDRDASQLLGKGVDAIQALTWDQEALVLEATNPATGKQYTIDDITVFSANENRNATLQDAIFARAAWLKVAANRDIATRFVRAATRGWIYCREHQEDCVQFVLKATTGLGTTHQRWMLNEVNSLIWPSADGIGAIDPVLWQQTINLSMTAGLITKLPGIDAYDDTIVSDVAASLADQDLTATDYVKVPVGLAPGGK